jgi:NAD(P)-dependent dehydrogenase (short-subunit alcohol dehydrogenase family)
MTLAWIFTQSFLVIGAVLIVFRIITQWLFSKSFVVHKKGIVVITGATTGIGRHAAEFLARQGYNVYAGVRKSKDADEIKSMSSRDIPLLSPITCDVTDHNSCIEAVKFIKEEMARLRLPLVALVNNAGVGDNATAEFHSLSTAKWMFDTNFWGAIDMTQQFLPLLRECRGRIVMISSMAAIVSNPCTSMYCASKRALEGYTDALRQEVQSLGVSVSIIEPAYVKSNLIGKVQETMSKVTPQEAQKNSEIEKLYHHLFTPEKRQKKLKTMTSGDSPQVTTDAIAHSVMDKNPKSRYVVASVNGIPAWVLGWLMWALPDRLRDFFIEHS